MKRDRGEWKKNLSFRFDKCCRRRHYSTILCKIILNYSTCLFLEIHARVFYS